MEEVKSKRQGKAKKVFKWLGFATLAVLAAGYLKDHRKEIGNGAVKTAGWVKAKVTDVTEAIKAKKA